MLCFFLSLLKRKLPQECPKKGGGGSRQLLDNVQKEAALKKRLLPIEHSGFAPSDWPIWTDLWGETSDGAYFFLVRATEKRKTVLEPKIP